MCKPYQYTTTINTLLVLFHESTVVHITQQTQPSSSIHLNIIIAKGLHSSLLYLSRSMITQHTVLVIILHPIICINYSVAVSYINTVFVQSCLQIISELLTKVRIIVLCLKLTYLNLTSGFILCLTCLYTYALYCSRRVFLSQISLLIVTCGCLLHKAIIIGPLIFILHVELKLLYYVLFIDYNAILNHCISLFLVFIVLIFRHTALSSTCKLLTPLNPNKTLLIVMSRSGQIFFWLGRES